MTARDVFVIHGRDKRLADSLFDFLRAIGLKPIEWGQAVTATGEAAPYIGTVLEVAFKKYQAVIALLTGDDEARLSEELVKPDDKPYEKVLTPQPRPNVIFEAGMALGVNPTRTVLVAIGNIRPWSDIDGRHILKLDNTPERRFDLVHKLETAGCEVDTTGTQWLQKGDFEKPFFAIVKRYVKVKEVPTIANKDTKPQTLEEKEFEELIEVLRMKKASDIRFGNPHSMSKCNS